MLLSQAGKLSTKVVIGQGIVVLIDGGGSTIQSLTGSWAFDVEEQATLCVVSTIVDSQGTGGGVIARHSGTIVRFRGVTLQRCNAFTVCQPSSLTP